MLHEETSLHVRLIIQSTENKKWGLPSSRKEVKKKVEEYTRKEVFKSRKAVDSTGHLPGELILVESASLTGKK
jgi:hypothetical protein